MDLVGLDAHVGDVGRLDQHVARLLLPDHARHGVAREVVAADAGRAQFLVHRAAERLAAAVAFGPEQRRAHGHQLLLALRREVLPRQQVAGDGRKAQPLGRVDAAAQQAADGAVPQQRLERERVDDALPQRHVLQGAAEVVGVGEQVAEDRLVGGTAGDARARLPIAPAQLQRLLQLDVAADRHRRRLGDELLQGALEVAEQHAAHREPLAVAQAAEALVVEVVREAGLQQRRHAAPQGRGARRRQVADDDLEGVAGALAARDGPVGGPDRVHAQVRQLHLDRLPLDGHELVGDRLPVLEAGVGDRAAVDAGLADQQRQRLGRRQLLLVQLVHDVVATWHLGPLQQFTDAKVLGDRLQSHGRLRRSSWLAS